MRGLNHVKINKKNNEYINQIKKNSYILSEMIKRNFKVQYRGSLLGVLWTVLNPLLNMCVLALVFSNLFGGNTEVGNYPIYLLVGTIIFNVVRQSTTQSLDSLVCNADLIKKVKISYFIFPISNMFTALVNFVMAFIALIIVMLIVHQQFYWTILILITILPALLLFSLGISLFLSATYVFFRDIRHLYDVGMTIWYYVTPMFYASSAIKIGLAAKIISINPMTHYITAARNVIQWGIISNGFEYLIMYVWGIAVLLFGYIVFVSLRKKYILYI